MCVCSLSGIICQTGTECLTSPVQRTSWSRRPLPVCICVRACVYMHTHAEKNAASYFTSPQTPLWPFSHKRKTRPDRYARRNTHMESERWRSESVSQILHSSLFQLYSLNTSYFKRQKKKNSSWWRQQHLQTSRRHFWIFWVIWDCSVQRFIHFHPNIHPHHDHCFCARVCVLFISFSYISCRRILLHTHMTAPACESATSDESLIRQKRQDWIVALMRKLPIKYGFIPER